MKSLNTKIAVGLIAGTLAGQGALAQDVNLPGTDNNDFDRTAPVLVEPATVAGLTEACTFYKNLLDLADAEHFNGPLVNPDHAAMVEASLQEMLRQVFFEEYYDPITDVYDESVLSFTDEAHTSIFDKDAEIASISFPSAGGITVSVTDAADNMTSYGDQCAYLAGPVSTISDITGQSPLELYELGINGALSETRDPHTSYLPPVDAKNMSADTNGSFGGLGIEINMVNGEVTVSSPMEGTPADDAGIMAGDVILKADGQPFLGMTLSEVVGVLRGPVGTDVNVTIRRGDDTFDVPITRGRIKIEAAEAKILESDPSTIQVRIKNFSRPLPQETYDKIHEQLDALTVDDTAIKNIVIDVRNNPGGLLTAGRMLTDLFIGDDNVGERERIVGVGRNADEEVHYADKSVRPRFDFTDYNIVVLQNQGSASASEILAGALQDAGIEVVGVNSFGKGSVQTVMPTTASGQRPVMGIGARGRLRLTTAAFFPGDTKLSNQHSGIIPDVLVQFNDIRDELAREARREADLDHTLISQSDTREGQIPQHICSLKAEFAGPLTDATVETLPADLVRNQAIRNEDTDEFEPNKFFDADLHCATMRANGQDETDYAIIYSRPTTPAPSQ